MQSASQAIADSRTCNEALSRFQELLLKCGPGIEASRQKMENIYAGQTPRRPYVEFALTDSPQLPASRWAKTQWETGLCNAMSFAALQMQLLPQYDFVPYLSLRGPEDSGYIARLFGSEVQNMGESGSSVVRHAISDASQVRTLVRPNIAEDPLMRSMAEQADWLADQIGTLVDILYPQLQGPSTNALRILPEEEGLVAVLTEPEEMEALALMITDAMIEVIKTLRNAVNGRGRFRPRSRFCLPARVRGVMVDDYISVMSPDSYLEVFESSWALMNKELGEIFLHTCGPVYHLRDMLPRLPGLMGFEMAFVDGQRKTVNDLFKMKEALAGRITLCSFGLPLDGVVNDQENLNARVLEELTKDGHFALQAFGTMEDADNLAGRLELDCR